MIYHYFLSANSAQGYIDLAPARLSTLPHVIHTTGYPTSVLRAVEGAVITLAQAQNRRLDIVHRPLDGAVTGFILPETGRAVLDTPLWLDRSRHVDGLLQNDMRDGIHEALDGAYTQSAAALRVHDAWEAIYMQETDRTQLDTLAAAFCDRLTEGADADATVGTHTDVFFGAGTPDGAVDYIACLTADVPHRYFLKGRPGTGKSTLLGKIAQAAQRAGWAVEVYHCSFDTNSLDMVVIRERGLCIFDSTAPHEYFPTRTGDEIIDLYAAAVRAGTDERHVAQLRMIAERYTVLKGRATEYLRQAHALACALDAELEEQLSPTRTALAIEQLVDHLFAQ